MYLCAEGLSKQNEEKERIQRGRPRVPTPLHALTSRHRIAFPQNKIQAGCGRQPVKTADNFRVARVREHLHFAFVYPYNPAITSSRLSQSWNLATSWTSHQMPKRIPHSVRPALDEAVSSEEKEEN